MTFFGLVTRLVRQESSWSQRKVSPGIERLEPYPHKYLELFVTRPLRLCLAPALITEYGGKNSSFWPNCFSAS